MEKDTFISKYNVELFTISLMVNRAKSKGLKEVCIEAPLRHLEYSELKYIANYLFDGNSYKSIEINFPDRRNAPHPSGKYYTKTLTIYWE